MATTLVETPVSKLTLADDRIEVTDTSSDEEIAVLNTGSDVDALYDCVRARYENGFVDEKDFTIPELSDGSMYVLDNEALFFVKSGVDPNEDSIDAAAVVRFPDLVVALAEVTEVSEEVLEGAASEQIMVIMSTLGGSEEADETVLEPEA